MIVALDVDSEKRAIELVDRLKGAVKIFKVGSELFVSCGPSIVERIQKKGCRVFLDLKFHDIPNTAAKAAVSATRLGVFIFNVHALGGYDMMRRVSEAVKDEAGRLKVAPPKVIAVTVLTSTNENELKKIGINDTMENEVLRLAKTAREAGIDGVVASPKEAASIRKALGKDFLIVTPGVRPLSFSSDDQKRIATPSGAIKAGADLIVVGRPIIEAADPVKTTRDILKEIGK